MQVLNHLAIQPKGGAEWVHALSKLGEFFGAVE